MLIRLSILVFLLLAPVATSAAQYKVLVIGDSLAQGLGFGLTRCVRDKSLVRIQNEGETSSRLAYNKPVNWFVKSKKLAQFKTDIVIIQIGANDIMSIRIDGEQIRFGSKKWQAELGSRAVQIIDYFKKNNTSVVWVGLPYPRKKAWQKPYSIINFTFKSAATSAGVKFIDIWDTFLVDGKYSSYGLGVTGKNTLLRADDGVHLSTQGYIKVANQTLPEVNKVIPEGALSCQK